MLFRVGKIIKKGEKKGFWSMDLERHEGIYNMNDILA